MAASIEGVKVDERVSHKWGHKCDSCSADNAALVVCPIGVMGHRKCVQYPWQNTDIWTNDGNALTGALPAVGARVEAQNRLQEALRVQAEDSLICIGDLPELSGINPSRFSLVERDFREREIS